MTHSDETVDPGFLVTPLLPWCAVCGRRVQSMTAEENFDTRAMEFVVSCHGATERVVVDREDIVEGARVEAGVAFGAAQIEARREPNSLKRSLADGPPPHA